MKNIDAVIIGGGVIGCSAAYHMAQKGFNVVLVERQRIGSESSGAAAGMLAAQAEMLEGSPLFPLAAESRALFAGLAEELREQCGIDIGLVNKGMLIPSLTPHEEERLKETIEVQRRAGEWSEWLTPGEVRTLVPGIGDSLLGAMYIPKDGHVSAPDLTRAFAQSAAMLGAQIREFEEVLDIAVEGGKVRGVITGREKYLCDIVIVAAGSWTSRLLQRTGLTLPVYPVKGECLSVTVRVPLLKHTVFTPGCYLVPKQGGRIIIGATMVERTFDKRVSVQGITALLNRAVELLPGLADAEWERAWAGLRPQTADGLPFLGTHPGVQGLIVAAGHYRNGILLSPVTGRLVTALAEGRSARELSIEAFRLDRGMEGG